MDIIFVALIIAEMIVPAHLGCCFFFCGLTRLVNFNPEYDTDEKKHSAIGDIILGTIVLLGYNVFFQLIAWPFIVKLSGLNLPSFSLLI
jgi:hypothetical protein